ncbi:MAG: ornithine carbamoyltransferase [Pseudomonadota bacterium]|jgi:ornithine carbamoyltransferase
MRHFLKLSDFTKEELLDIIDLSVRIKNEAKKGEFIPYLEGKTLAMIFEKSSTRTRVSFEVGIYQLGGIGLFLSSKDLQLGRGEPLKDTARVIGSMCDLVMIRTYDQSIIEEFAAYSKAPVINGLTTEYHPAQLLADYMTVVECGLDKNLIATYIGDGNNMANSWIELAAILGFEVRIACPKGYEPPKDIIENSLKLAAKSGGKIIITDDPIKATEGATVVTTDVWTSMGQEEESAKRLKDFQGFCVDEELMQKASKNAIFLHCLPAHRGEEVSDGVMECAQSKVFEEAENRLHAQKGIMVWLSRNQRN